MLAIIPDEELLSRRRLGKTTLSVKPGQIGTSNATKPENLGVFEYAHLRAPIPKDLRGSEIFSLNAAQQTQSTYFLMVCALPFPYRCLLDLPNGIMDDAYANSLPCSDGAKTAISAQLECSKSHFLGRNTRKRSASANI